MLSDPEFWVAVSFLIFLLIIIKVGAKPIAKGLDARAARIKGLLDDATNLRGATEKILADERRHHAEALEQAKALVAHAHEEAEQNRRTGAEALEASLKRRERAVIERIEQAEARAVAEVRKKAVDVAIAATRRLLAHGIDSQKADALLDDSIGEVARKLH